MKWVDRLEPYLGKIAIPHLTQILVWSQAICWILGQFNSNFLAGLPLVPELVLEGEVWRLISFIIFPPLTHPIFVFFALYIFYFMGTALEAMWGAFRFTLYIVIGCLATIVFSFLTPQVVVTNIFIGSSVFLAFATMFPNQVFYLFFVLPVKVKYLAWLTGAGYVYMLVVGTMADRWSIVAALINYFLFFTPELWNGVRYGFQTRVVAHQRAQEAAKPFHECAVCKVTEKKNPELVFRVCSQCEGGKEFCEHHQDHRTHQSLKS